VIAVAALSGPLPKLGVIALGGLVGVVLLAPRERARAAAMLVALGLAPALLLIDIWHSPQLSMVHRHPALAVGGAVVIVAALAALAILLVRRPWLTALLVVAALPFRIPVQAGGKTSNLLVPLYAVVAAGALAFVIRAARPSLAPDGGDAGEDGQVASGDGRVSADGHLPADGRPLEARRVPEARRVAPRPHRAVVWLERILALDVLLYAVQSVYSSDFETALQHMVFFYVPFALMFALLRRLDWTPWLLRRSLQLVAGLAVVFAIIGFVEYATKTIILNPKLVVENDLHAYFTVNSVFFDPDIFGRFLALVMVALAAALLYARRRSEQLALTAVLAVLWLGLVLTLSRSSLGALLLGLATLAALRWRPSRTLVIAGAVVALGAGAVLVAPKTFGLNQGLNGASSGRAGLVRGGIHMFGQRPVWGYGSGAFVNQYRREHPTAAQTLAASHTIAVTIAAEQGLIGELVYVALILVAVLVLMQDARADPARAALAAAFIALILHTNLYADFLEDPVTWTLLGVGAALAAARPVAVATRRRPREREATAATV
jgi:O-antigen ligase